MSVLLLLPGKDLTHLCHNLIAVDDTGRIVRCIDDDSLCLLRDLFLKIVEIRLKIL